MQYSGIPESLYYWIEDGKIVEHIWLRKEGEIVYLGITELGIETMGDPVSLAPNGAGRRVEPFEAVATIESSKWVGPISSPVKGEIIEVNNTLAKNPSAICEDPYGNWIVALKLAEIDLPPSLISGSAGKSLYIKAAKELEERQS